MHCVEPNVRRDSLGGHLFRRPELASAPVRLLRDLRQGEIPDIYRDGESLTEPQGVPIDH
jgi:hypothetical protein